MDRPALADQMAQKAQLARQNLCHLEYQDCLEVLAVQQVL